MSGNKRVDVSETLIDAVDALDDDIEFDADGNRSHRTVEDAAADEEDE